MPTQRPLHIVACLLVCATGLILGACGGGDGDGGDGDPVDVINHRFTASAMVEGDRSTPVETGSDVVIQFESSGEQDMARLRLATGCDYYSSDSEITSSQIISGELQLDGSDADCTPAAEAQREWIVPLVEADPEWALSPGGAFTLSGDGKQLLMTREGG